MPLFGRRREAAPAGVPAGESRFTAAAAARGWEPVAGAVFDPPIADAVQETARVLHGTSPRVVSSTGSHPNSYKMNFHDAFRTERDGRAIVVANGAININPGLVGTGFGVRGVGVCVVELPSVLAVVSVEPRHYRHRVNRLLPEHATGNAAFDERFVVSVRPGLPPTDLTADMQRLIMARDDWIFREQDARFMCVSQDPFGSVDEMAQRIDDVLAIVASVPTSVLAARVDHSDDDLVARIGRLENVEDAIAFLQQLTPAERERLARSETPLAAFADVTSPEQAIARFQSLDPARRMQLVTMFQHVDGNA